MRFHRVIAIALALVCAAAAAHAERRVALVIGNDRYANLGANEQLQKAVNDARAIGGALRGVGFDVIAGENLGRRAMLGKFDELVQRLEPGDTAFFFFSGHGVALEGVNYMLPADVPDVAAGQDTLLKREALDEPYIVAELTGRGVRVAIVVLDACRTNPFVRSGKGVGVARGLAPPPQVSGVFSLYAAAAGQSALDRLYDGDPNPNSVFSRVLAPMLAKPGMDLRELAFEVRQEVARVAATAGHVQRPEDYDRTLGGKFYLAGAPAGGGQPLQKDTPAAPPPLDVTEAWKAIQGTTSVAIVDEFIQQFGNVPVYGALARRKREELAKSEVAVVVTPVTPPPRLQQVDMPLTAERERALKPKDTFRECADCPEMVVVPAGSFTMGSPANDKDRSSDEGPQHTVTIGRPFAAGKLHVTVDQFAAFVRETRSPSTNWRSPGFDQQGLHPVVRVTWDEANAYADWLAKKTGRPYRLLSEAEWEYAARGRLQPGTYPRFWFGDDEKDLCRYANFMDQTRQKYAPCNDGYEYTSPAGHFLPNAFGLYDMFGNAWQWTADCWHGGYGGAPADGSAWTTQCSGSGHVARGGSWSLYPRFLRAAQRIGYSAGLSDLGFRLARTLTP
jgi:formylglycine-generating enzyme required for sulfatase activity